MKKFRNAALAVIAFTSLSAGAFIATGPADAANRGDWVCSSNGNCCKFHYPYVDGGGVKPGYVFDINCNPVRG